MAPFPRTLFRLFLGVTSAVVWAIPGVAFGQTFYVSSGSHDNPAIDKIDSTGNVSLFATQSVPNSLFYGLGFDTNGILYASDVGTGQVDKINASGAVSVFASLPSGARPAGLTLDNGNNVYVADYGNNDVWKITPDGTPNVFVSVSGGGTPYGLAFDNSGNLYLSHNTSSGQIDKITPSGGVSVFATMPNNVRPAGLVFDNLGNLYAAASYNFNLGQIYRITPSGVVSLYASLGYSPSAIAGLACDSTNDLFTADYNTGNVYKIAPDGKTSVFTTGLNLPTFITIAPIPEPATWAMLVLGMLMLLVLHCLRCRDEPV